MQIGCRLPARSTFGDYVPDFQYYLVPVRDYGNKKLLEKADEVLQETPPHLVDIISNVLYAFLLKENVPVLEAEELVGKVKDKKMAELFEDMEKMDIQAERRKTEEQRQRAENAIENGICFFVESCQELSIPQEIIFDKLIEKYQLTPETATQKLEQYWKS